ncbi:MAG TPA: hypothetical protein DCE56_29060 [Cyanobacteria bacterium UBA8553]|nr:hypothetical protein [Cyanobacteria bacterium UBA8553]HAJ60029.1 hypothetical protein [Cyanobacteria bacterium UBA8543]
MRGLKTCFLSVFLLASPSFGLIALAQSRWPESEKRGYCPVNTSCNFPQNGSYYNKPSDVRGIGGFYVNLTSPDSSALIMWEARKCDGSSFSGNRQISTNTTGQNYTDFPSNVCNFKFTVTDGKRYRDGGNRVDFLMNFDVDR